MKSAILLLSGVSTSVALLIGGLAVVQAALPAHEPRLFRDDKVPLWTSVPVKISDRDNQPFERVAAWLPADTVAVASLPSANKPDPERDNGISELDMMVTAALDESNAAEKGIIAVGYSTEHFDWCANQYRTYQPEDNSYRSYSGMKQECRSPYGDSLGELAELQRTPWPSEGSVADTHVSGTAEPTRTVDSVQADACAKRYRSYRSSDNSYQPYGGGPRKPCEITTF